jgi:hypothetical protein
MTEVQGLFFSEALKLFNSNFELRPISIIKDLVAMRNSSPNVGLPLLTDEMSQNNYKQSFFLCVCLREKDNAISLERANVQILVTDVSLFFF